MEFQWLKHLARIILPVYQYETDTMKIAYAGYSSVKKKYFVRFIMDRDSPNIYLRRKWFWEIPDLIESRKYDIVISEISRISLNHFQKCNGFILPVWVDLSINIDIPLSEICERNKSVFSNVKRRIRKYNLTYEVLTDKENFNYYIDKFYLPYATKRFGEEANIVDTNLIWESATSPFLMAIKEDGIIVAESFYIKSGDTLRFINLGLLDGNEEYLTHGVVGALYYFRIIEGQKMGCKYINPGVTRPFLTDGLTKNKMGFGADFLSEYSQWNEYIWIGVNEYSSASQEFIRKNPFIYSIKIISWLNTVHKWTASVHIPLSIQH
jgi:hypothetical protein